MDDHDEHDGPGYDEDDARKPVISCTLTFFVIGCQIGPMDVTHWERADDDGR